MASDPFFARNVQIVRAANDGKPGKEKLYAALRDLQSREISVRMQEDLRPVSVEEAKSLFEDYYMGRENARRWDLKRKNKHMLIPGSIASSLFRHRRVGQKSDGPGAWDMMYVDDSYDE